MTVFTAPNSGLDIVGTVGDDLIMAPAGSNRADGGAGDDLLIARRSPVLTAGGTTAASAVSVTGLPDLWTRSADATIQQSTAVPHATAVLEGSGSAQWFLFRVGAGQSLTVDVDFGAHAIGGSLNSRATLFAANGTTVLASNGDAAQNLGGEGSTSNLDSYLNWTNAAGSARFVLLRLTVEPASPIPAGATMLANFSLTGQAVVADLPGATPDLYGGDGNDVLIGYNVFGGAGDDLLSGQNLTGGEGADTLKGDGDATVSYQDMTVPVLVNLSSGLGGAAAAGDVFSGIVDVVAGIGNDTVIGNGADNFLRGERGDDRLVGNAGRDELNGADGADLYYGGTDGAARVLFADVIFAGDAVSYLGGGPADVSLTRGTGIGNEADGDQLFGIEALYGSLYTDVLEGDDGRNLLSGNGTSLTPIAGLADTLRGGLGDDIYILTEYAEQISDSGGFDTVSFTRINGTSRAGVLDWVGLQFSGVVQDDFFLETEIERFVGSQFGDLIRLSAGSTTGKALWGLAGDDSLSGGASGDTVMGGEGNDEAIGWLGHDWLDGGGGSDDLSGGKGNDTLIGSTGADLLLGDQGVDRLQGGAGNDTLTGGGAGRDVFVFSANGGRDSVTDGQFTGADHDVLDLSTLAAITSFADLRQNHLSVQGADLVISANGTVIVLQGVALAALGVEDVLI